MREKLQHIYISNDAEVKHQALLLLFAAAATCCHHTRWPARILMREKITKYLFFPLKLK